MKTFIVLSSAGAHRDLSKGSREQAYWDEHEVFIDGLVDEGFIMMGGPFSDGGALLIVWSESEAAVRAKMSEDPWYDQEILTLVAVKQWDIFIDKRT